MDVYVQVLSIDYCMPCRDNCLAYGVSRTKHTTIVRFTEAVMMTPPRIHGALLHVSNASVADELL